MGKCMLFFDQGLKLTTGNNFKGFLWVCRW